MQISFVYILLCSDNSYYVGITNDLFKRFKEHKNGTNSKAYTYNRRPLELVTDINLAIVMEKQIKKWSKAKKEALIKGYYKDLPNLAKKKFD